ncbi:HEAT repeat domain-containing protein [Hymenobacter amundsenii]|nr:HEAT repeat domain-containing protein [Hymenobacter amundsenii]
MPNSSSGLESLRNQALGPDAEAAYEAFESLTAIGTEEVAQFYLALLETAERGWRNRAAMGLAYLGDERAVAPLLQAIQRPETRGCNGTMVYALTQFDCRHLLKELFQMVFQQGYEAQLMALMAIEEQDFEYSIEDVAFIQQQWAVAQLAPSTSLRELGLENIGELVEEL